MTERQFLHENIVEFLRLVHSPDSSESDLRRTMAKLERLAPDAMLSDLIFYGDRECDADELVDEAMLRQQLAESQGGQAILDRIAGQMSRALENPASTPAQRYAARLFLADYNKPS